jgi:hypothetical protein
MANAWFRLYSEFADDPKVQMMPETMQRRLVMLMCSRCKEETLQETQRAFHWRISMEELTATKELFITNGFIDQNWKLLNWNRRQFLSDSSTDRVRKYRQGLKHDETLQMANVTAPEQNRTDTEQKNTLVEPAALSTEPVDGSLLVLEPSVSHKRTPEDYVTFWNKERDTLPAVILPLSDSRKTKLKTRIARGLTPTKLKEVITKVQQTPYLLGDNASGWRVSFDFLIANDDNIAKILGGNYDRATKKPARAREFMTPFSAVQR